MREDATSAAAATLMMSFEPDFGGIFFMKFSCNSYHHHHRAGSANEDKPSGLRRTTGQDTGRTRQGHDGMATGRSQAEGITRAFFKYFHSVVCHHFGPLSWPFIVALLRGVGERCARAIFSVFSV